MQSLELKQPAFPNNRGGFIRVIYFSPKLLVKSAPTQHRYISFTNNLSAVFPILPLQNSNNFYITNCKKRHFHAFRLLQLKKIKNNSQLTDEDALFQDLTKTISSSYIKNSIQS
ncbi:MAG TPA: hypothetical protein DDW76_16810 [Cyanobacteria bacterium UBA11369]|nr:hypothetical protein [Cyanobacteria bacterium UBA11371]HBE50406.1 hypothetical protein [Cyanobacteria bacterium UBA11369]